MTSEILWSTVISALLILLGIYFLFREVQLRKTTDPELIADDPEFFRNRFLRRVVGAVIFLIMGVAFYLGPRLIDEDKTPKLFTWFWVGVLSGVMVLVCLALMDVLAISRFARRQIQLTRDRMSVAMRDISRGNSRPNMQTPDGWTNGRQK